MAAIVAAIATQLAPDDARQQPVAVERELYDAYRALDTDRLLSLLSPAITFEDPTMRLRAEGRDQMRKTARRALSAFVALRSFTYAMA